MSWILYSRSKVKQLFKTMHRCSSFNQRCTHKSSQKSQTRPLIDLHLTSCQFHACVRPQRGHKWNVHGVCKKLPILLILLLSYTNNFHESLICCVYVCVGRGKFCLCLSVYLREWCVLAHWIFLTGRFALHKSHPLLLLLLICCPTGCQRVGVVQHANRDSAKSIS